MGGEQRKRGERGRRSSWLRRMPHPRLIAVTNHTCCCADTLPNRLLTDEPGFLVVKCISVGAGRSVHVALGGSWEPAFTVCPSLLPGRDTWRPQEVSPRTRGAAAASKPEPVLRAAVPPAAGRDINGEMSVPASRLPAQCHHTVLTHRSQNIAEPRTNFSRFYIWENGGKFLKLSVGHCDF